MEKSFKTLGEDLNNVLAEYRSIVSKTELIGAMDILKSVLIHDFLTTDTEDMEFLSSAASK